MNLGQLIATETHVQPEHIMLLRHSNTKVRALRRAGGSLDEYTYVQPKNSHYDYLADGETPVQVVAVIVEDCLYGVYWVDRIEREGTTRTLVSAAFRSFDLGQGYPERPARKYVLSPLPSSLVGRAVRGWTSTRNATARYGGRLFSSVEVD